MYNKREFMDYAKEQIKKMLPKELADKLTIEQTTVIKVNDQELHGLVFKREDDAASPTIYLDQMYERYKQGEQAETMIGEMAQFYLDSLREQPAIKQPDMSYDKIKDHVTLRLVELKRNRMYLVNVPYMTVGNGLALVCDIKMDNTNEGFWRTTVTKDLMAEQHYDKKELFVAALSEAEKIEPPVMVDMEGKLFGAGEGKNLLQMDEPITEDDKSKMYVLSNESGVLGAAALFYPGVQENIAEKLGESYYALPSSLHEIIIVPESAGINKAELGEMVKSANQSVVEAKDVLSDNVFRYDKEEKQLTTSAHTRSLGSRQEEARC